VPIQFRCPKCDRRLSIAQRKAGEETICPNCKTHITVPIDDAPPTELPELIRTDPRVPALMGSTDPLPLRNASEAPLPRRWAVSGFRIGAIGGLVVLLAIAIVFAGVIRKPATPPELARSDDSTVPAPTVVSAIPQASHNPPLASTSTPPAPSPNTAEQAEQVTQSAPLQPTSPLSQMVPGVNQQPQVEVGQAPPPRPLVPLVAPVRTYDRFGNPIGPDVGLGKDGEFKGKRLLFWSGYENAGKIFFGPTNPLWKAWERQGFTVIVRFGQFRTEWLRDIDQLWILSTGRFEIPLGLPPEAVVAAVDLLPLSEIPSGFTPAEYKFIVQATLDMSLSPVHPFDAQTYRAVEKFVQSGKGVCLLSDDEPFTVESNELAKRLYGVTVKGNYIADKVAYVRDHKLAPADIRKFGGQYEVADHRLLTGVNFLYEGITISNVGESDKLEVALKASDGQPLIAVSKVPGQRVVIDCAFTQFCHGPTERTSYILKSAGAVRLAQNIAAYLAGK
jgi:phage FluMu protein Com